jgi:hypothetical protein
VSTIPSSPAAIAARLQREFELRTRALIAIELMSLGIDESVIDEDQAALVVAASFATMLQLLDERDHDGRALWTLAGDSYPH